MGRCPRAAHHSLRDQRPAAKAALSTVGGGKSGRSLQCRGNMSPWCVARRPARREPRSMGLFPMQIVQTPKPSSCCSKSSMFSASILMMPSTPSDLELSFHGRFGGPLGRRYARSGCHRLQRQNQALRHGTFTAKSCTWSRSSPAWMKTQSSTRTPSRIPSLPTGPWTRHARSPLRPGTRIREYAKCVENDLDVQRYEELLKNPSTFMRKQ